MDTISVVTPSLNQGAFIEETIRSVIFQRGDFYIDFIIMDGGSTDNSVEVIKKYENLLEKNCTKTKREDLHYFTNKKNSPIAISSNGIAYRWVSESDRGQVHALKKGFRMARGEIFGWLNSDDIFDNQFVFQKVLDYFRQDPELQLLTADGPFITREGNEIGVHHVDRLNYRELLFLDYHILQPSTFFLESIYHEDYLREKYTCAFDADFFIHLIKDGVKYKKVDDRFGAFRFYADVKTLSLSKRRYKEQVKISWTYSKNIFFLLISIIYRYVEVVLKQRYKGKSKKFDRFFLALRRLGYRLITGQPER